MAPLGWADVGDPLEPLTEVYLDEAWLEFLPDGAEVVSSCGDAASYWSQTARVTVKLIDGQIRTLFMKITRGNIGQIMAHGEFESMKALYAVVPHMVPEPLGYGTFSTNPDIHFIIMEFIPLHHGFHTEARLCPMIADFHRRTMGRSPTGKFGFHVTTCNGRVEQDTTWTESWEVFYIRLVRQAVAFDIEVLGPCPDYDELCPTIYDKVCPRLLRPLETEGRTIQPTLVHGDLWNGNVALKIGTDTPIFFDSSAFYAHHEYELHMWSGDRFEFNDSYIQEYFKHIPKSEPVEDFDDRMLLYSLMADLHDSILHGARTRKFRALAIESMRELVARFASGYQGRAKCKGEN